MLHSVAFIPDGNRRYALKNALSLAESYSLGFQKAEDVADWCFEHKGIREATIWSLSTENLKRSSIELTDFMDILKFKLDEAREREKVHRDKIRFRIAGRLDLLPKRVSESARKLEEATEIYSNRTVNLCIGYGGRAELMEAFKKLVDSGKELNEENLETFLYLPESPDLIIRTGGNKRLSGFMPWQSTYSELHFSNKLWPEFSRSDFEKALNDFYSRERRFGL